MQSMEAHLRSRAYNRVELDAPNGIITKSSDTPRFADEINYYKNIPHDLRVHFPRMLDYGVSDSGGNYAQFEYYPFQNLGHAMINRTYNSHQWEQIYKQLAFVLNKFRQIKAPGRYDYQTALREMYIDKTINEYKKLIDSTPFFKELEKEKKISINGQEYDNFLVVWDRIRSLIESELIQKAPEPTVIHGDCCFGNLLCDFSTVTPIIKMIDPRGSFGEKNIYGDWRYDWAKIIHSCWGQYESIVQDLVKVTQSGPNEFGVSFPVNPMVYSNLILARHIHGWFTDEEFAQCKLINTLIFVGMIARHSDSLERQKCMYLQAIFMLNQVLSMYEGDA